MPSDTSHQQTSHQPPADQPPATSHQQPADQPPATSRPATSNQQTNQPADQPPATSNQPPATSRPATSNQQTNHQPTTKTHTTQYVKKWLFCKLRDYKMAYHFCLNIKNCTFFRVFEKKNVFFLAGIKKSP